MTISDRLNTIRQRIAGSDPPEHEARLLQLYWNRAELKKEYSRLQAEHLKLKQRLRDYELAAEQAHEQLAALEDYLGDPNAGVHALVYFQLRGLWRNCARRVERFAAQLQQQQTDRERRRQLIEFDQARSRALADLDRRILDARSTADVLEAQLKLMSNRLASMRGFWNYFRRRRLLEEIETARAKWDAAATQVTDLSDERAELESAQAPPFPGLSVDGRRIVNTAVIAYAQQLVVALSEGGLAMLAKETTTKRLLEVSYGDRAACERLLALLSKAEAIIERSSADLAGLKERTDALRASVSYRSDADTIPLTDSIGTLPTPAALVSGLETANRSGINVLVDDYWDVYKALLQ
jgi:DNA repair exonuclease SbcCD ATPase subunit